MEDIIEQIVQIEKGAFGLGGVNRVTIKSILKIFKKGLITITKDNLVIGYLGWEKHLKNKFPPYNHKLEYTNDDLGKFAYVSIITVEKEYRSQGIGTRLLEMLSKRAKEEGCTKLYCPVNQKHPYLKKGVMHFWKKNGFKITGEVRWGLAKDKFIPSYIFTKYL